MEYRFDRFRLDTSQFRLHRGSVGVSVEPLVFDLLSLFMRNPGAVVSRERMIEEVWHGRNVSDATLSTAIKSARKALGDDGAAQNYIETVRGRGFRFRVPVAAAPANVRRQVPEAAPASGCGPPSIAVLPFVRVGELERYPGLEDAIPYEVILALSRLRWLFVIARNSSFQFRGPDVVVAVMGEALGARYCLTGSLEIFGTSIAASVELSETASGHVVWGDRFAGRIDDVHQLRADVVAGVAASMESQIPLNEALSAQATNSENLDAWQVFHLGLKAVHQYSAEGNAAAEALFRRAIELEPALARAHAGLSFAHFQNAFMGYRSDRENQICAAKRSAERGVELDPMDPFSNLTLGRSLWLQKELDSAIPWLERAVSISPNYAQAIYSRALLDSMMGRTESGGRSADLAMRLSPLDPLLYGMRGVKALSSIADGDYTGAAAWGDAAARTPRAHVIIDLIAAASHGLNSDAAMARHWADVARARKPDVTQEFFFNGLPVQHYVTRQRIAAALAELGF